MMVTEATRQRFADAALHVVERVPPAERVFGVHKFYLGQIGLGIVYLLFCWTFIPALIGFVEGILYLTMSDQAFAQRHLE